jgi:predicted secreted Zn-dependent protease
VNGYPRVRTNWNPLMDGEWKLDGLVVEGEHAVEWVHEHLYLRQGIRISNDISA